jgi:threonine/homoserine/homoserine lactone efflux protein
MTYDALSFLVTGTLLGLAAGLAPGPLLTLVVTESLSNGFSSGLRVALAPLVSDSPIVLGCLYVLSTITLGATSELTIPGLAKGLGVVSLIGAGFLVYLARQTWSAPLPSFAPAARPPRSLMKGALVNLLSPHPYLFWLTIGTPLMATSMQKAGMTGPVLVVVSFYAVLVGAKMAVAYGVARSSGLLTPRVYTGILRGMAIILVGFAIFLAHEGVIWYTERGNAIALQ